MVVVGCAGGGACTGGGFGGVVVVVVVVSEDEVLTVMSATSGVGTMLTGCVVLVPGEIDVGDEIGLESKLHPAMPSTMSSPALAKAGIHNAFRVNTGAL